MQRFTKVYLKDRVYGAHSRYVGQPGMDHKTFAEAVAHFDPHNDRLLAIPLPHHVTYSTPDFFEKSGRLRYVAKPFMDLLVYYIDAVASQGLAQVVQIRTFVRWVTHNYKLLIHVVQMPNTTDDQNDTEDKQPALDDLIDKAACDPYDILICRKAAEDIFNKMENDERRLFLAVHQGDNAHDWQLALGLQTIQQAYAAKRKLEIFLKSQSAAIPELAACGRDGQKLFLDYLFILCKKGKLPDLP